MQHAPYFISLLTLPEALQSLEQKTGRRWTRGDFFANVIRQSLPLRSTTPFTTSAVHRAGSEVVSAELSDGLTRPMAALQTRHVKDLWVHGEAGTKLVALDAGQAGFLTWEQIKSRRIELNRERTSPQDWNQLWPDSDWHDGEFMGESDSIFLSETVTVTDQSLRVPAETIDELVGQLSPKRQGAAASVTIPTRQVRRLTANSIDALIEKAIGLAGGPETGPVFLQLKEMALQGVAPFTGQVDGTSLIYTDDRNTVARLSKDLLRRRLSRRFG